MKVRLALGVVTLAVATLGCGKDSAPNALPPPPVAALPQDISWGAAVNGFQAGLEMSKRVFETGAPISLGLCLKNVSGKELKLRAAGAEGGWRLLFTPKDSGVPRMSSYWAPDTLAPVPVTLANGEKKVVTLTYDGRWTFIEASYKGPIRKYAPLPLGRYAMTASHACWDQPEGFWAGEITTGPVEIEIVEAGKAK